MDRGLSDLRVGEVVEVEGTPQADGSVLARNIKAEDEDEDEDEEDEDEDDDGQS